METLEQALIHDAKMSVEEAQKNASFDLFLRNGVMNNLSFGIIFTTIIAYFLKTKNYDQIKAAAQKPEMVKVKKQKGKTKRK